MNSYQKWNKYHKDNPHVYEEFCEKAKYAFKKGLRRYSARTIIETIRWKTSISTTSKDFKISNCYSPFYARLFAKDFPQLKEIFNYSQSQADKYFDESSS